jgi:hypothetical protein
MSLGIYGDDIQPVGDYLLKEKGSVRYSEEFYDGTAAQERRLRKALGIGPEKDYEDFRCYPPPLADLAAGQLEDAGLVVIEELPDEMMDGLPDYTITLTEAGRAFVEEGGEFEYYDL